MVGWETEGQMDPSEILLDLDEFRTSGLIQIGNHMIQRDFNHHIIG